MRGAARPRMVRVLTLIFRGLVRMYPRAFREAFGKDLVDEARDSLEESAARGGTREVLREMMFILGDTVGTAAKAHLEKDGAARRGAPVTGGATESNGGEGMMGQMAQDLRYAVRTLAKSPGFTFVVIATLAVGMGANVAMFGTVHSAFMQDLPFSEPGRLVLAQTTFDGSPQQSGSSEDYLDYRRRAASFDGFSAYLPFEWSQPVTGGTEPEILPTQIVADDLFATLGVAPVLGRRFLPVEAEANSASVVMISHQYWQRRFGGDGAAVGSTVVVSGQPSTVVGVMPAGFWIGYRADIWMPLRPDSPFAGSRRFHNWGMVGRLADGASLALAQADVDVISAQLRQAYPDSNDGKALLLSPLQDALVAGYRDGLFMLMGAIALVLLIACGNVAGLLLARGSSRRQELSVRSALGATRARVVRQLLTESVLLALVSGVVAAMLGGSLQATVQRFLALEVPGIAPAGLSWPVFGFTLLITLATALLFGVVPALQSTRTDVATDLRSGGRGLRGGQSRLRQSLVVAQVALSVVLLAGSGLLIRSFARLSGVDPGFQAEGLLTAEIRLPGGGYTAGEATIFFTELLRELRAVPGVEDAALISQLPIRDPGNNVSVWAVENPPTESVPAPLAYQRVVTDGYFRTLAIPVVSGRPLEATDTRDAPPVMVISESLSRTLFPDGGALGKLLAVDRGMPEPWTVEVVGVIGDVRMSTLGVNPEAAMYFSYAQRSSGVMRFALRARGEASELAGPLRQAVWGLDADLPVAGVATMGSVVGRSIAPQRVMALALSLFAAVAMFLAVLGLYGVLAYYVGRRVHEIGVRVALGAAQTDVMGMVLRRGLSLVAVGLVVGVAAALASTRLLQQMLFGVEATDPVTFIAVSVFFALVALVASFVPARRASRIDPVVAFRTD